MKRFIPLLALLFPLASVAGESMYHCTTKQILQLSDRGLMEKHSGIYKPLVDKQFFINRKTGEMIGLPFSTQEYKQITVLDEGSHESSYKAIVTSHPPNIWVMYIYVAQHNQGRKKPFWGTPDSSKIFSGYCE